MLDALSKLDGRARSPHSNVDKQDAAKVREALANEAEAAEQAPVVAETPAAPVAAEPPAPVATEEAPAVTAGPAEDPDNPPTTPILIAEATAIEAAAVPAPAAPSPTAYDYGPLFVAPQAPEPQERPAPVRAEKAEDVDEDAGEGDDSDADADGEGDGDRPARRRRRGRRGRGRGRGEQAGGEGAEESGDDAAENGDATEGDEAAESAEGDSSAAEGDESNAEDGDTPEGASRRRRRRRRRKAGSGDDGDGPSDDDPPNTVVHERKPRAERGDEIQGISGSTRLEAKRQRRRDGRDAGRRRPPILTEAEFLARREAVDRVMVVRDKTRTESPHEGARYTQIAVLEDGVLVEHFVTSAASASLVGNIYLGVVQNVLPSMEAAFVDIGRGRNGVLYAGEVNWDAAGLGGSNRKIEQALKSGDYVLVQVSKDPVGHKGARLTTQISLAGRYLVYVPGASSTGISRKLPDTERQRLKEILRDIVPSDAGVIIRTASEGVREEDIRADVQRLQEQWQGIEQSATDLTSKASGAAMALYEEPDVLVKVVRDLFNEDFSKLTIEGDAAWETIDDYVKTVAPDLLSRIERYEGAGGPDVFTVHRIDEQLAKALDRKVWLPSGGTLVIDRTEAMTVVDVNTGKFTGAGGNLEETVTRNNLEAAEEIVRQLRLRDVGGIVVIDFIDMVLESNRDLVLRRLTEALGRDRTRHQVSEVTSLGLVQLTRKKLGTGLIEAFSSTCSHCAGRGIVLHVDPVDNAGAAPGGVKKAETGRRAKRSRKGKAEEVVVSRTPSHPQGEHPMFKAMAAANGHPEDDEDGELVEDVLDNDTTDEVEEIVEAVDNAETPAAPEAESGAAPADSDTAPEPDTESVPEVTFPEPEVAAAEPEAPVVVPEPAAEAPTRPRRRRSAARAAGPPVEH
ncbi:ribonuclease E [Mycobacteroides immunogenum]|uniref:Ribonuclease E n=1 Tax=Mycobacteroides immunogenum TaxID=83262 RepID=A0A7V8LSD8_9MYCO|nr:Rne/Rng family ribonuclease [Mycobacteroides immunogenum]AMT73667.1 ribonuclease E [Mycobacteroides immunogenum]ANO03453.1 ribonuclease E [Mycobacteroides immunogenum]KIU42232.1 ribonuclease E [Mycobacteroides immunogenum]KPG13795.1 ribonuclease E [Mycobacteroides immunogenum]KPG14796.1 ribonuclease E [Mycobacteroides immunogenum]